MHACGIVNSSCIKSCRRQFNQKCLCRNLGVCLNIGVRASKKHYKSWTPWTNSYWTDTIVCVCVCGGGGGLNPCPVLFLNQQSFVFTLHLLLAIRNSFIFILMTLPSQHHPFRIKNWKYRMQQIVTLWPVSGDSCPLWARNNNIMELICRVRLSKIGTYPLVLILRGPFTLSVQGLKS